jgi:hypothetical protein
MEWSFKLIKHKKMNKNYFLQLLLPMLFITVTSCGQTPKAGVNKTPVALGKIYQLPAEPDAIIPNTNPQLSKIVLNDYIMIIQWHFEMRFTDAERKQYEQILIDMWNNNEKDRKDIQNTSVYANQLRAKDLNSVNSERFSRGNHDIMDCGMEGLLQNWEPNSLRGNIKKGASNGDKESVFLWNKITAYEQPVAEGKIFVSKFTQMYIDAAAEWMAYKINVVANKQLIILDEEKREQMGKMIMAAWKKEQAEQKSEYEWGNVQAMLSSASTYWNYLRLTKRFSLDSYITNYNKLSTLADWAKEVVYYCPAVKPYAEQRIKELKEYAAKMSDAEWQLEFKRLNMQMDMSKQVFQQMKNQMVESHVLMLNIIEGDDRWEVKERKTY